MSERKRRIRIDKISVAVMDNFDDQENVIGTLWLLDGDHKGVPPKISDVMDRQIKIRGNVSFRFKSFGHDWRYEAIGEL